MRGFKYLFIFIYVLTFLNSSQNTTVTGNASYYFINRLSNSDLINIPFRLMNINIYHQREKVDVNGTLAIEYKPRTNTDFIYDSDPVDFKVIMRELYITYYLENGEISVGKKFYNWGSADENSPIDVLNPYDYYYLFDGTSDRKLGIYSSSFDFYLPGEWKISGMFSPMHNTSRFPSNDPDYPIELPGTPDDLNQIFKIKHPYETAFSIQKSTNNFDFKLSYVRAHDRVFGISGANIYQYVGGNGANPFTDLKYSYRLTEAKNLGIVMLFNDFTVRTDIGYFRSFDENSDNDIYKNIPHHYDIILGHNDAEHTNIYELITPDNPNVTSENACTDFDNNPVDCSFPFKEDATYIQGVIQFEIPLPEDYQINLQYFEFSIKEYRNLITEYNIPHEIDIPNVQIDLSDPESLFFPGLGAPISLLSKKIAFISLEKSFLDNDLNLTLSLLNDIDEGNGKLYAFESEYDISNKLSCLLGITKINGDSSQGNFYRFNAMKDFSHIRTELTYNF